MNNVCVWRDAGRADARRATQAMRVIVEGAGRCPPTTPFRGRRPLAALLAPYILQYARRSRLASEPGGHSKITVIH
jgi:hypothetical protein